jgi:hypothetical protein
MRCAGGTRVKVNYKCHEGMIHHFYAIAGVIPYANMAIEISGDGGQSRSGAPSKVLGGMRISCPFGPRWPFGGIGDWTN